MVITACLAKPSRTFHSSVLATGAPVGSVISQRPLAFRTRQVHQLGQPHADSYLALISLRVVFKVKEFLNLNVSSSLDVQAIYLITAISALVINIHKAREPERRGRATSSRRLKAYGDSKSSKQYRGKNKEEHSCQKIKLEPNAGRKVLIENKIHKRI